MDGVRYEELAPMPLNEMQRENTTVAILVAQHEADAAKLDIHAAEIRDLNQQVAKVDDLERQLTEMHAALLAMQSNDQIVAQR
jgi:hypothetical protein